jgi:hypothetical protein
MISKNISYKEATHSTIAKRLGIDNTPNAEQMSNMKYVAESVFQPVREHFNCTDICLVILSLKEA